MKRLGFAKRGGFGSHGSALPSVDFSAKSSSYPHLTYVRSGSTIEGANGDGTTSSYAADVPVWEDRGDGYGGGLSLFGAYANVVTSPDDFSTDNWANFGATYTAPPVSDGLGPDGSSQAPRVYASDPSGSGGGLYFVVPGGGAPGRMSVWVKSDATQPPNEPGALMLNNSGGPGVNFALTTTWSYASVRDSNGSGYPVLYPAGAQWDLIHGQVFDASAAGAVNVHGYQIANGQVGAVPVVRGTTGQASAKIDASVAVNAAGDLDLTIDFSPFYDSTLEAGQTGGGAIEDFYLCSLPTANGLYAVRYLSATAQWVITDDGTDVLTTSEFNDGSADGRPSFPAGFHSGDRVRVRLVRKASTGDCGIELAVNGCSGDYSTYSLPSGGALVPTDGLYLASNLGTSSPCATRIQRVAQNAPTATPFARSPQGIYAGDSQTASIYGGVATGARVLSAAEASTHAVIATVAVAGATIDAAQNRWSASPVAAGPAPTWMIIRAGVNDLLINRTPTQMLTEMQSFVSEVKALWPDTLVFVSILLPSWGALTSTQQGYWTTFNAGLAGLTGVTAVISSGSLAVDDGSHSYTPTADAGDHLHPSDVGRALIALGDRSDLATNGVLV